MKPSFSKPVMIVLVLCLIALFVVFVTYKPSTLPDITPQVDTGPPLFDRVPENAVETDEQPEFDVYVATKLEGPRYVLEFRVAEIHSWAVQRVYVEARHRSLNAETGEWEFDSPVPVQILLNDIIDFDEPVIQSTTLVEGELNPINYDIGTDENWVGHVYHHEKVFKPKPK
jgi:hypothetical protein